MITRAMAGIKGHAIAFFFCCPGISTVDYDIINISVNIGKRIN